MRTSICIGLALFAALWTFSARADEGHDHGATPASASGPALPRFAAVSELFELVGVVNDKQLTVYLDRFGDNAPVKGATVELEVGGKAITLKEHAEGEFEGTLAQVLASGVTPVTATIKVGNEVDLLAGEMDVHEPARGVEAPHSRKTYLAGAGAAVALLLVLAWLARRMQTRRVRLGGAA